MTTVSCNIKLYTDYTHSGLLNSSMMIYFGLIKVLTPHVNKMHVIKKKN